MRSLDMILFGMPQKNSQRVLRGGNWINNARNVRSANRNANSPDNRNHNIGLRLAGALLINIKQMARGSINQWLFLFVCCRKRQQNQDSQRVSKLLYYSVIESLLQNRLFLRSSYVPN